jgi:hypothetical protein
MINLLSPSNRPVLGEGGHIRERKAGEPVHFLEKPEDYHCGVCGKHAGESGVPLVWTDRPNLFDDHPSRCGERKKEEKA